MRTLLLLVAVSGCYSPEVRECVVGCAATADCVSPLVCGGDGLCASTPVAGWCSNVLADAGSIGDASADAGPTDAEAIDSPTTIDAMPAICLAATCIAAGGSCMNDRCVIDRDNSGSVTCPAGMPCTVICDAQDACKNGVSCGGATSCIVLCTEAAACQDKGVDCGTAQSCDVTCRGPSACQHGDSGASVECRASTCSVTCDGSGACQDGIAAQGTCDSHCCNDACEGGTATCTNDSVCS
jgi:hypothetical protein